MTFLIPGIQVYFILILVVFNSLIHAEEPKFSNCEDFVYEIIYSFETQMKEELGLKSAGRGASLRGGGIEEIHMEFQAFRRATIEEARILQLYVMNRLVQAVNANEQIQPYLLEHPFTYKRIKVSISFVGSNGLHSEGCVTNVRNINDLTTVAKNKNNFFYRGNDPFTGDLIRLLQEPYEEAVRLAQATPMQNPCLHHTTTEQETELDQVFSDYTVKVWKEIGLYRMSIGAKITNGMIEEVGAHFTSFYPAPLEEARTLGIIATQMLLNAINSNEKLKHYLKQYPFPTAFVKLCIEFRRKDYFSYYDGTMESVKIQKNEVSYFRNKPMQKNISWGNMDIIPLDLTEFFKESYQEAFNIVQKDTWGKKGNCSRGKNPSPSPKNPRSQSARCFGGRGVKH